MGKWRKRTEEALEQSPFISPRRAFWSLLILAVLGLLLAEGMEEGRGYLQPAIERGLTMLEIRTP